MNISYNEKTTKKTHKRKTQKDITKKTEKKNRGPFSQGGSKTENPVLRTNMLRGGRKGDPNINVVGKRN